MSNPEYWLRGPVDGVIPVLQPVAHALLQARDDVTNAIAPLSAEQLWTEPGGAASVGFHVRHLAGSLDRLYTYARGEPLSADHINYLKSEPRPPDPRPDATTLANLLRSQIEAALAQVRTTPESSLLEARSVGRQGLPSNTLGLLFHGAEHCTRHAGQIITTAKIVEGS